MRGPGSGLLLVLSAVSQKFIHKHIPAFTPSFLRVPLTGILKRGTNAGSLTRPQRKKKSGRLLRQAAWLFEATAHFIIRVWIAQSTVSAGVGASYSDYSAAWIMPVLSVPGLRAFSGRPASWPAWDIWKEIGSTGQENSARCCCFCRFSFLHLTSGSYFQEVKFKREKCYCHTDCNTKPIRLPDYEPEDACCTMANGLKFRHGLHCGDSIFSPARYMSFPWKSVVPIRKYNLVVWRLSPLISGIKSTNLCFTMDWN